MRGLGRGPVLTYGEVTGEGPVLSSGEGTGEGAGADLWRGDWGRGRC